MFHGGGGGDGEGRGGVGGRLGIDDEDDEDLYMYMYMYMEMVGPDGLRYKLAREPSLRFPVDISLANNGFFHFGESYCTLGLSCLA